MLLAIILTVSPLFYSPILLSEYSPAPAIVMHGTDIHVTGFVYWSNGTPAEGVEVRIFATDELTSEIVLTHMDGQFRSNQTYEAGQVLVLTVMAQRFRVFIPYFAGGTVSLGDFFIDETE